MKKAEEILRKHTTGAAIFSHHKREELSRFRELIYSAMEEYAQQFSKPTPTREQIVKALEENIPTECPMREFVIKATATAILKLMGEGESKEFKEYLQSAKDEFVLAVNDQQWNPALRVKAENFILAFDQLREKIT